MAGENALMLGTRSRKKIAKYSGPRSYPIFDWVTNLPTCHIADTDLHGKPQQYPNLQPVTPAPTSASSFSASIPRTRKELLKLEGRFVQTLRRCTASPPTFKTLRHSPKPQEALSPPPPCPPRPPPGPDLLAVRAVDLSLPDS